MILWMRKGLNAVHALVAVSGLLFAAGGVLWSSMDAIRFAELVVGFAALVILVLFIALTSKT